jgi:hypothetical protein
MTIEKSFKTIKAPEIIIMSQCTLLALRIVLAPYKFFSLV